MKTPSVIYELEGRTLYKEWLVIRRFDDRGRRISHTSKAEGLKALKEMRDELSSWLASHPEENSWNGYVAIRLVKIQEIRTIVA